MQVLDDPSRLIVVSDYLRLEVLSKPLFLRRAGEVGFMSAVFEAAAEDLRACSAATQKALRLAADFDLSPMDALHVGTAIIGGADEFVTVESPLKPMFRVTEVRMVNLSDL
jgi:predicted nucleic acid-binding protein